ncbi:AbrB family transcriptional regulator [Pseudooceanicola nanhaiensis]|uniref:AbrB family transcriptional regulator n=1 Tax=Pseudooceanicola nanhaiensis TaxID=375761 RepID=UPI001CD6DD7B|nr:AbrB family transcriptional regulator [Pseudooceanicola nanhaiensis]MCA0921276.1 AbrB family transcriptional regulator [Pseudooceanicola nanhaiensis]
MGWSGEEARDLRRRKLLQWAACVLGAILLTGVFRLLHLPAAALLGPAIASTFVGVRGGAIRVPKPLHQGGQGVAGCLIAQYLTTDLVTRMGGDVGLFAVFVAATLAMAVLTGLLVGRLSSVPEEEAIWGFLPGMAGAMIAMSEEQGVDSRYVAFMQITRLLVVILTTGAASAILLDSPPVSVSATADPLGGPMVLLTLLVAVAGFPVQRFLPWFPTPNTLVPMVLAAGLKAGFGIALPLPMWLLLLAFFLIGCDVGLKFTPALIRHVAHSLPVLILASLGLMAACATSGVVLAWLLDVPLLTALLATIPGSIESVAIIAINSHADVTFVMTLQTLRLFAVVFFGPMLARRICRRMASAPGE